MRRELIRALVPIVAGVTLACSTPRLPDVGTAGDSFGASADERRLLHESEIAEDELRERGLLLDDAEVQEYLDRIGAALVPAGLTVDLRFHFRVLRDPTINAFALPNGGIYVHTGLLARLENEMQLAYVLAHEITHTLERHALEFLHDFRRKTVTAKLAQLALVPVGAAVGLSPLPDAVILLSYAASVSGYSREAEMEADLHGLRRIAAAGYEIVDAPRLFELLSEAEDPGQVEAFFLASHPRNRERADYTRELLASGVVASAPASRLGAEDYVHAMRNVVRQNLELRLRHRHYAFALQEAERALASEPNAAHVHYYVGEAHRRTAEDPEGAAREAAARKRESFDEDDTEEIRARKDSELAVARAAFQRALELDPGFALAHRGLGLVARQAGDAAAAGSELALYLESDPPPHERRYIESVLREIEP